MTHITASRNAPTRTFSNNLRITWAITRKDIVDGLKNKNVIAVILPALFVVILYRFLPAIMLEEGPPRLWVYDVGNPAMVALLEESPVVNLRVFDSQERMFVALGEAETPELGISLPKGFDQAVETGQELSLQGYTLYIFSDEQIAELQKTIQDELEYLVGKPVTIQIERIQLLPESGGISVLTSLAFTFLILIIGLVSIPYLLLEEKQNKTLDAILVSPATDVNLVMAKALTGVIYILIAFGLSMLLYYGWIVNWGLILAGVIAGALFAVSVGMVMGIAVDNRQQLTLWAWMIMIPLFLPTMFSLMEDLFPTWLVTIFNLIPSTALMRILRSSMVAVPPLKYYLPQFCILIFWTALFIGVDAWLLRRWRK